MIIINTSIAYYVFVILAWGMIYLQPCISAAFFFLSSLSSLYLLNGLTPEASGFSMVFNVLVRWQSLLSLFGVLFHPDVLREACFYFYTWQKVLHEACEQASGDECVCACHPSSVAGSPGCFRQELRYLQSIKNYARWNLYWHCINRTHNGQALDKTFIFSCYWWPFRSCSWLYFGLSLVS